MALTRPSSSPTVPPGLGLSLSLLLHVLVGVLVFHLPATPPPRSLLEVFVDDSIPTSEEAASAEPTPETFPTPTRSSPERGRPLESVVPRPPIPRARPVDVPQPTSARQPSPPMEALAHVPTISPPPAAPAAKSAVGPASPEGQIVVSSEVDEPQDSGRRSERDVLAPARATPTASPTPENPITPVSSNPTASGFEATPVALNVPQTVTKSADPVAKPTPGGSTSSQTPATEFAGSPESDQSDRKLLLTARATPMMPAGTGDQEPPTLTAGATPGEPASTVQTKSDVSSSPPSDSRPHSGSPAPDVMRAAPGLPKIGTTIEQPIRPSPTQLQAPETDNSLVKPGPSDRRAVPTPGTSRALLPGTGSTEPPASTRSLAAGEPRWGAVAQSKPDAKPSPAAVAPPPHRMLTTPGVPPAAPSVEEHAGTVGRPAGRTASRLAAPKADAVGLEPIQSAGPAKLAGPVSSLPNRETATDLQADSISSTSGESMPQSAEFAAGGSGFAEAPPAVAGPGRVAPAPNPAAIRIVITSPRDGLELAPDDPPIVVVEGEVDDVTVPTVWLMANDVRIAAPVRSGRFRRAVVMTDPTLRIHAEVPTPGGPTSRSSTVAVHSTSITEFGIVLIDGPETAGAQPQRNIMGSWRSSPERLDESQRTFPLRAVPGLNGSTQAFYFRRPKPGVYAFVLSSRGSEGAAAPVPTMYLPRAGHLVRLVGKPITGSAGNSSIVGRVLLPYAVLWEQDDWFTGRSESVDTVTKFRVPEGVTWIERKVGLQ